uniref:CSON000751 protein n=1 Tax=Culicoides sonorensis TaxID=179676 RepID=A0A336LV41_CULSO
MMKSSKSSTPTINHSSETSHNHTMDTYDEENTNTSSSTVDFSLLRKPIITSVTGFPEAKKAYDSGTDEIRKLLANECDLIYECKVCRNIFRSLVNFISHKRVYCQTTFRSNHHFHFSNNGYIDQDISTIIQAENEFIKNHEKSNGTKSRETENRDLSAIVERLIKKQKSKRESKLSDFYEQIEQKLLNQQHNQSNSENVNGTSKSNQISSHKQSNGISTENNIVLQLNAVPESSAAVYQTLKLSDNDNIRDEVNEVHEMLENNNVILDPNGKAISVSPVDMAIAGTSKLPEFACEMCDERFSTEKTLKIHIAKKHIPSTVVHQCPSCTETFLTPGAVLRHLSNVHKKSQKRIKQARDKCMKGTRVDEIPKHHQTKEVPPIRIVRKDDDIRVWTGDFSDNTPTCPSCYKKFDRKAVLTAHVQNCGIPKETKQRKKNSTPKIPVIPKLENESNEDYSTTSCDTNASKTFEAKKVKENESNDEKKEKSINKRKRKGQLLIRNESPEVKDEAEMSWSNIENKTDESSILDESQIKKELVDDATDEPILTIEEPTKKKRKIKKEKDGETSNIVKDIPCALCSKKFSTNTNLKRHVAMFHFRQNRFACKKCDFRGYRRIDTITHLNNIHNVQGEKEEVNQYIEISIKEEDLKGPINTKEKCDPNLTFSSVVASIDLSESVPGSCSSKISDSSTPKPRRSRKSTKNESGIDKEIVSKELLVNESFSSPIKSSKDESGSSGMSSPTSDKISDADSRRPTRNRIKPVRKDFVYDLNKIIKQEAEVHRENQQHQQLLFPSKGVRGRKSLVSGDESISEKLIQNESSDMQDKENLDESKISSIKISEISGAALKMAKIEVMNQRACFHKPPEIPAERPFVPAKVSTPRRSDGKIIKDVPALLKSSSVVGGGGKRGKKRNEIKRVPSFTDQFLSNTGSDKRFKVRNEAAKSEPIAIFPIASSSPPLKRTLKASKKQELSNKEKSQLEMLQRFRNENSSNADSTVDLEINNTNRISVLQRLAENKCKSQEFSITPNIED